MRGEGRVALSLRSADFGEPSRVELASLTQRLDGPKPREECITRLRRELSRAERDGYYCGLQTCGLQRIHVRLYADR